MKNINYNQIVAIALPSINKNISSILYIRISSIIFIYSGALILNALYIQSIGSGTGIYTGLFHVTVIIYLLFTKFKPSILLNSTQLLSFKLKYEKFI